MSESEAVLGNQETHWFWKEAGADIRDALTSEQQTAVENAVKRSLASSQPADIRLHLGKYFVRITAGKERRNRERLKEDLKNNPIFTKKNAPLIAILWALSLLATLYIMAFIANVLARFVFA